MKLKTILFATILTVGLLIAGCGSTVADESTRISLIYTDSTVYIYRDNETGVQYISRYNAGTCVMVDADGNPYTGR